MVSPVHWLLPLVFWTSGHCCLKASFIELQGCKLGFRSMIAPWAVLKTNVSIWAFSCVRFLLFVEPSRSMVYCPECSARWWNRQSLTRLSTLVSPLLLQCWIWWKSTWVLAQQPGYRQVSSLIFTALAMFGGIVRELRPMIGRVDLWCWFLQQFVCALYKAEVA